jgi:aspartyl-tRNA(Asn)/glutamyl-tRNA(Gln) amidotransferase subunit A
MKIYDKALRMRRVIVEEFAKLFTSCDAVLMPACSTLAYGEEVIKDIYKVYEENFYTAPASITGLPAVVVDGVQLVGNAFSDNSLLSLATIIEKEGK